MSDPTGIGMASVLSAPGAFSARPGLEGPQVVLTWEAPEHPAAKMMIRRKQGEHPRDVDDGVLVYLEEDDPAGTTTFSDIAADLLPTDAEPGEGVWWYYRAFVWSAPLEVSAQFGGRAVRLDAPIDVQGAECVTLYGESTEDAHPISLQHAPEYTGPWRTISTMTLDAGQAGRVSSTVAMKWVRAKGIEGACTTWLVVQFPGQWTTSPLCDALCYVFKTGRHYAMIPTHLPQHVTLADTQQGLVSLVEALGADGETWALGQDGATFGPLSRFLMVYLAEMDRVDAYLRAVRAYAADVDTMPPQQFAHVAQVLGYPLETDGRNLEEIRAEILRIAGVWKSKGTSRLVRATCHQILGVRPRVQEGAGRVFRVADPDLYGR